MNEIKVIHRYKLYHNGFLDGIYTEKQLVDKFGITIATLRFNVANNKEFANGFLAEITEDEILKEKTKPTDPKMRALLEEWDEVRKMFKKSLVQKNENIL